MNEEIRLHGYTQEQIDRFNVMHQELTKLNEGVEEGKEIKLLNYSKEQMAEYSRFRETALSKFAESLYQQYKSGQL
jgi:hypothetical protein